LERNGFKNQNLNLTRTKRIHFCSFQFIFVYRVGKEFVVSCRNERNFNTLFLALLKKRFSRTLFGCSIGSELEAKIYDVLMTSYVLLRYFKVPNGSIKVTLQTIRSICSAKCTAPIVRILCKHFAYTRAKTLKFHLHVGSAMQTLLIGIR